MIRFAGQRSCYDVVGGVWSPGRGLRKCCAARSRCSTQPSLFVTVGLWQLLCRLAIALCVFFFSGISPETWPIRAFRRFVPHFSRSSVVCVLLRCWLSAHCTSCSGCFVVLFELVELVVRQFFGDGAVATSGAWRFRCVRRPTVFVAGRFEWIPL